MADITYDEWMELTKKRMKRRSAELKRVDEAFKEFERRNGAGNTLQTLSRAFQVWIDLKGADEYLSSIRNRKVDEATNMGPVERLQSLIREHKMSNVGVKRDLAASIADRLVMDATLRTDAKARIKVKETYDRANLAVHAARDMMVKAGNAGSAEQTLYQRWFGAYDATRHQRVKKNFKGLCDLFDTGVIIVKDARTLAGVWGDCFGFAMPGEKKNYVEFTIGRAFFLKTGYTVVPGATPNERRDAVQAALRDAYSSLSDWTVGTMVHELGHATNGLPDVDFQAPATYQISPGGMTPPGWDQCSTPALDLALAIARPDLAVENTDSYGQCAREALEMRGR